MILTYLHEAQYTFGRAGLLRDMMMESEIRTHEAQYLDWLVARHTDAAAQAGAIDGLDPFSVQERELSRTRRRKEQWSHSVVTPLVLARAERGSEVETRLLCLLRCGPSRTTSTLAHTICELTAAQSAIYALTDAVKTVMRAESLGHLLAHTDRMPCLLVQWHTAKPNIMATWTDEFVSDGDARFEFAELRHWAREWRRAMTDDFLPARVAAKAARAAARGGRQ